MYSNPIRLKEDDVSVRLCSTTPWNGHLNINSMLCRKSNIILKHLFFNRQLHFKRTVYSLTVQNVFMHVSLNKCTNVLFLGWHSLFRKIIHKQGRHLQKVENKAFLLQKKQHFPRKQKQSIRDSCMARSKSLKILCFCSQVTFGSHDHRDHWQFRVQCTIFFEKMIWWTGKTNITMPGLETIPSRCIKNYQLGVAAAVFGMFWRHVVLTWLDTGPSACWRNPKLSKFSGIFGGFCKWGYPQMDGL